MLMSGNQVFATGSGGSNRANGPIIGQAVSFHATVAVRDLPRSPTTSRSGPVASRINPRAGKDGDSWRATWHRTNTPTDPLIRSSHSRPTTPPLDFKFEGGRNPNGCGGCSPPDPNGDVGPNNYVQTVNATKVAVFDKTGNLLAAPFDLGSLWPGGGCVADVGDPVVLYDRMANRWLISQLGSPSDACVAISQSGDPLGSYFIYDFSLGDFPDYLKFGVWNGAYLAAANESTYSAYAFERAKMLVGDRTAHFIKFTGGTNFLLPADIDGATLPPAGTPGFFYTFKDHDFHGGGPDRIELWALDFDFANPPNSTFTLEARFAVPEFTYTVCGFFNFDCVRQRGTTQRIDVVSEWPMHRFPYRNFGDHQTLLGNFTVGGGTGQTGAAIRWFELRNTGSGWNLFQTGTYDPGDGNDRFLGSIAMDGAGDIALGFAVSSSATFPSIHYVTRTPSDPPGTFGTERAVVNGRGSQTQSDRWGDYSAMTVDPVNDCSFWYTHEFYPRNSGSDWHTAVGVFTLPSC
jgi:hypothetical protein